MGCTTSCSISCSKNIDNPVVAEGYPVGECVSFPIENKPKVITKKYVRKQKKKNKHKKIPQNYAFNYTEDGVQVVRVNKHLKPYTK